jgi:DNA processing protein
MENFEEKACICALGKIFGFKPKIAHALIEHLGSAREVFRISRQELEMLLGPHSQYIDMIRKSAVYESADELEKYARLDISYVGWTDKDYPGMLKECQDAPVGLYIRSRTHPSKLWPERRVAVVGTRDVSPYGKEWCVNCIRGLASTGEKPLIVSGLALGTDICAHKAALEAGLPTVAVMATGPENVYPYRHRSFADEMCQIPGCALVTDYPPGTAPLAVHFIRRNRIIAGLSEATVLIESKIKGGGMMTARLAFSYDRDVYALPGRVDDIRSQGCNLLIRSKVAEPLTSVPEFLDSLGMKAGSSAGAATDREILELTYKSSAAADRVDQMARLLTIIRKNRGITIEELAEVSALGYARTVELTSRLETDGFICTDLLQRCSINPVKR